MEKSKAAAAKPGSVEKPAVESGSDKKPAAKSGLKIAHAEKPESNEKPAVESGSDKKSAVKSGFKLAPASAGFLLEQYKVLSDRRMSHDKMTWEIPAFAAQSILIGLSFGAANDLIQILTAFIALLSGILSIQYFERNRIMEVSDSLQLNYIENYFLSQTHFCMIVHHKLEIKTDLESNKIIKYLNDNRYTNFFNRASSYALWKSGRYLLTIASLIIFLYLTLSQFSFFYIKELFDKINIHVTINMQVVISLTLVVFINWLVFTFHFIALAQHQEDEEKYKEDERKYNKRLWIVIIIETAAVLLATFLQGLPDVIQCLNSAFSIFVILSSFWVYRYIIKKKKNRGSPGSLAEQASHARQQKHK